MNDMTTFIARRIMEEADKAQRQARRNTVHILGQDCIKMERRSGHNPKNRWLR